MLPLVALLALAEPAGPVLAVLPLLDKTGLAPDRQAALTDYLRVQVAALGRFSVVDKGEQEAETKRLVEDAQASSYASCVDEACQIPLGKQLAASLLLRSRLERFGAASVLSLELIDVATATSKHAVSERSTSDEAALLSAIERAVTALGRRYSGQGEVAVVYGGFGIGGLVGNVVEEPPPPEKSAAAAITYFSLTAAFVAGGVVLDVAPDSAHNGGLDFLDVVPALLYGTALILGLNGVFEL